MLCFCFLFFYNKHFAMSLLILWISCILMLRNLIYNLLFFLMFLVGHIQGAVVITNSNISQYRRFQDSCTHTIFIINYGLLNAVIAVIIVKNLTNQKIWFLVAFHLNERFLLILIQQIVITPNRSSSLTYSPFMSLHFLHDCHRLQFLIYFLINDAGLPLNVTATLHHLTHYCLLPILVYNLCRVSFMISF